MSPEPLGRRIRRYRRRAGLIQDELAARMQSRGHDTMFRQRIVEIENGKRDVSASELVSLARVLDVPISELLGVPDYIRE